MRIKFNVSQLAIYFGITSFSLLTNLNKSEAKTIKLVDGNGRQAKVGQIVPQSEPPNLGFGTGKPPILEGGVLKHPDNRSYEVKYLPPNDVFNFDPLLMFMGAGQGDPARINKQTGKFQLKINGVWRCVSASQPVSCNRKSALRQKDFKKPLTAQQIRDKLVRTGASKTSNEQIMAHIKELGGVRKFLQLFEKQAKAKIEKQLSVTVIDSNASKGKLHPSVNTSNPSTRKVWFQLPDSLTFEEKASVYYRVLFGNKNSNKFVIIAHGWNDSPSLNFQNMGEVILRNHPEFIVLFINWSEASTNKNILLPGVSPADLFVGANIRAAKWILPTAKILQQHATKELGLELHSSFGIGHSLGSHLITSIGSFGNKFSKTILLDPPSSLNGDKIDYDIDGNTKGQQPTLDYNAGSKDTTSFTGDRSFAGNNWKRADKKVKVNFRAGNVENNPGREHFHVVETYTQIVGKFQYLPQLDIFSETDWQFTKNSFIGSKAVKASEYDAELFVTLEGFNDGTTPSLDSLTFVRDEYINIVSPNNIPALEQQLSTNLMYSDKKLTKLTKPFKVVGGKGTQANCSIFTGWTEAAATNLSDIIDMSRANKATLCGWVQGGGRQIDKLIGAKNQNTFVMGNTANLFYSHKGNQDYAIIQGFNLGVDKIRVKKSLNYQTLLSGSNVILSTMPSRKGGLWWLITWAIGDGADKIAEIQFNSQKDAELFIKSDWMKK